jgi:hypothetical protein
MALRASDLTAQVTKIRGCGRGCGPGAVRPQPFDQVYKDVHFHKHSVTLFAVRKWMPFERGLLHSYAADRALEHRWLAKYAHAIGVAVRIKNVLAIFATQALFCLVENHRRAAAWAIHPPRS